MSLLSRVHGLFRRAGLDDDVQEELGLISRCGRRTTSPRSIAGLALGLVASRLLAQIVYEATPRDPMVLCGVLATMAILGLLSTWIPARRALAVDPASLLREQ